MSRSVTSALAALFSLFNLLFVGCPAAHADDRDLAQALRAGDLVIVVRHGATFPDQADTDPLNFDNIAAQRNLNDKGKALAKTFGDALRQAEVPIGKVYTSKFNRAYETAVIAGFKDIEKTTDLDRGRPDRVAEREQPPRRGFSQDACHRAEGPHQHDSHHASAEHRRGARQGLVRRQGG